MTGLSIHLDEETFVGIRKTIVIEIPTACNIAQEIAEARKKIGEYLHGLIITKISAICLSCGAVGIEGQAPQRHTFDCATACAGCTFEKHP